MDKFDKIKENLKIHHPNLLTINNIPYLTNTIA
jgi:hypothetical protein